MNPFRRFAGQASLAAFAGLLTAAAGQYDIGWHRIGGGGGVSSGGTFGLAGTIGQAEAGSAASGPYALLAGYWNLLSLPSLVVAEEDPVTVLPNRSIRVPLATLTANDRSLLGYGLALVSVDASSARGGTLTIVGGWVVYQPPAGAAVDDSFGYVLGDGLPGSQHTVTGTVRLNLGTPAGDGPAPNAVRIAFAGPDVEITFLGVPDRSYRVQYTADVAPPYLWTEVPPGGIRTAPANGVFTHVDPSPSQPFRLYRAVAVPAQ